MEALKEYYGTPDGVFEILNLRDPTTDEQMIPSNVSFPTYAQLERQLMAESQRFDARCQDTWRTIRIQDYVFDRGSLWSMNNLISISAPVMRGGWETQLLSPIQEWNPKKGDKLEIRHNAGNWIDITDQYGSAFWFDYKAGIFYYTQAQCPIENAFRITYRYGRNEQAPYDIEDAIMKRVAIWVMSSDFYRARFGGGGDLSAKNETIRMWNEDYNNTLMAHLNCGMAISSLP